MLLAALLFSGGCAGVAEVTGTASQQDVLQLRSDLTVVQSSVRQLKSQVELLGSQVEARLREQAAESERTSSGLTQRLDGLAATLSTATGRLDELSTRLEALQRQLRAARQAPRPAPPAAAAPSPPAGPPPAAAAPRAPTPSGPATPGTPAPPATAAAPPGARPATGRPQPQDLYQAAYIDFSKGNYTLAVAGFREFLRRYPDHPLASNAQYWIGEAHVGMARGYTDSGQEERAREELERAVREFRKVVADYPRGEKAPTALYKEALVLIDLKQPALAEARLQYLIENFPQAEETRLARDRLAALRER